jgi:outer membrane protein assembly factor BamB
MPRLDLRHLPVLCLAALVVVLSACSGSDDPPTPTRTARADATAPPRHDTNGHHDNGQHHKGHHDGSGQHGGRDDWTTYHYSQNRRGNDPNIPDASGTLKAAWSTPPDGAVYAEPLVVGTTVIAVTENDTVYGLSLQGKVIWKNHLGDPVPLSKLPCGNIDPLGITGTPIYWKDTDRVYFVAELDHPIRHRLYSVDPSDGTVDWSRSVDPDGATPSAQQQRGAMAIANGRVWVSYGALAGDCGPYHGWAVGALLSGKGALSVYRTPSARGAGLWAPTGPSVDAADRLYVAPANGAAFGSTYDDSDSVVKLDGTRKISLWAPKNWADENRADRGQGPTAPLLFSALGKRWAFVTGKAGPIYLLRRGDLGGIGGQAAQAEGCPAYGGSAHSNGRLFGPCTDGMRAYTIKAGPRFEMEWHSDATGYGSAPVTGGGAVWAVDDGKLVQLDPATGRTVATIAVGDNPHFATPTLHGSLVLVGTLSGVTAVSTR